MARDGQQPSIFNGYYYHRRALGLSLPTCGQEVHQVCVFKTLVRRRPPDYCIWRELTCR